MHKICLSLSFVAGVAVTGLYAAGSTSTGTAAPIAAETFEIGDARTLGPALVNYDPRWSAPDVEGGRVVLLKVVNAVTSVVAACEADASGICSLALESETERNVRLLHTVEVNGERVGDTLVADIGFGKESATPSEAIFAASTNALQTLADAKEVAPLAYSTDWAEGVTKVKIGYACEEWSKGRKYGEFSGTLLSAAAPATGAFDWDLGQIHGGAYTLTYTMYGEGDDVVGTYEARFSLPFLPGSFLLIK